MTRGRRPTPTHLRLLNGNPQHRPLPTEEPEATGDGADLMPPWLRVLDAIATGLNLMTLAELRAKAREIGVEGRSGMSKEQLVAAIQQHYVGPREAGWQELAPMLETMRVLTAADVHALAMTVDQYVFYIGLRRIIEDEGQSYATEGRYGEQQKRRPEVDMASRAWDQVMKGLIEFGMTPASRSRVAMAPAGDKSALEKLLDASG